MAQENAEREKSRAAFYVALLAALPLIYVLSIGPAGVWFRRASPAEQQFLHTLYAPLGWLGQQQRWVSKALDSYIDWCDERAAALRSP